MTPAERIIRSRNQEIANQWTRGRFMRLSLCLRVTEMELAAMAGMERKHLTAAYKSNRFDPAYALHLENMERFVKETKLKVRYERQVPQLEILNTRLKQEWDLEESKETTEDKR